MFHLNKDENPKPLKAEMKLICSFKSKEHFMFFIIFVPIRNLLCFVQKQKRFSHLDEMNLHHFLFTCGDSHESVVTNRSNAADTRLCSD